MTIMFHDCDLFFFLLRPWNLLRAKNDEYQNEKRKILPLLAADGFAAALDSS